MRCLRSLVSESEGEWLVEKHGTRTRRAWRKLRLGVDADTGQIVAAALTSKEVDDAVQVGPLLDKVTGPLASVTADGAYDQDGVYADVAERHPDAAVIVPPRRTAVLSDKAGPRQRSATVTSSASPRRAAVTSIGQNTELKQRDTISRIGPTGSYRIQHGRGQSGLIFVVV